MFPDLTQFYMSIYGGYGYSWGDCCDAYLGLAAGIPQAGNPPYTVSDFLLMYPKFAGLGTAVSCVFNSNNTITGLANANGMQLGQLVRGVGIPGGTVITDIAHAPVNFTGDTTINTQAIANVSSTAGLFVGQPIAGAGIPAGATISSIGSGTISISVNATATAAAVSLSATSTTLTLSGQAQTSGAGVLTVYEAPPIALAVIQVYLNLAYASLMSSRWREQWPIAMGWFIAHFLTLYLRSEGTGATSPGAIAVSGLEQGILVSSTADGVSFSIQPLAALANWAAWTETTYGTQFATAARVVGAGATYYR